MYYKNGLPEVWENNLNQADFQQFSFKDLLISVSDVFSQFMMLIYFKIDKLYMFLVIMPLSISLDFQVDFRCQHKTRTTPTNPAVSKNTGCEATLSVIVKRTDMERSR